MDSHAEVLKEVLKDYGFPVMMKTNYCELVIKSNAAHEPCKGCEKK